MFMLLTDTFHNPGLPHNLFQMQAWMTTNFFTCLSLGTSHCCLSWGAGGVDISFAAKCTEIIENSQLTEIAKKFFFTVLKYRIVLSANKREAPVFCANWNPEFKTLKLFSKLLHASNVCYWLCRQCSFTCWDSLSLFVIMCICVCLCEGEWSESKSVNPLGLVPWAVDMG